MPKAEPKEAPKPAAKPAATPSKQEEKEEARRDSERGRSASFKEIEWNNVGRISRTFIVLLLRCISCIDLLIASYCLRKMFWFVLRNSPELFVYMCSFLAESLRKHHWLTIGCRVCTVCQDFSAFLPKARCPLPTLGSL